MTPEEMNARLLYRDGLILVINKPAGIAVHRGAASHGGTDTDNLEAHFDALRFGLPRNPALAHRLDKDTSGCLVLGRHRKALEKLGLLFKQGKIAKTYWAIVEGSPEAQEGLIDLALGRRDAARGWWMKADPKGAPSQTRWRVMGRGLSGGQPIAWLAMEPLTGRTHQLRVHSAAQGWPILGDTIYGTGHHHNGLHGGNRLQLHARDITIPLSKNHPSIKVTAPVPEHMQAALEQCGWMGEA